MRRALPVFVVLTMLGVAPAHAAGINLAWNNCVGGGGSPNRTFACNTNNSGAGLNHILIVSARPPAGISEWCSFEADIIVGTSQASIPAWWQLGTGQCRPTALGNSADPTGLSGCSDPYLGFGVALVSYQLNFQGSPDRARIQAVTAIPNSEAHALTENDEYFVLRLTIANVKTVGTGACAGCQDDVCLVATRVKVVQNDGAPGGDVTLLNGAENNSALWQSATAACVGAVPARRSTWNDVKGLYR